MKHAFEDVSNDIFSLGHCLVASSKPLAGWLALVVPYKRKASCETLEETAFVKTGFFSLPPKTRSSSEDRFAATMDKKIQS